MGKMSWDDKPLNKRNSKLDKTLSTYFLGKVKPWHYGCFKKHFFTLSQPLFYSESWFL